MGLRVDMHGEDGGVLLLVAILIPVLLLMASFAIDVSSFMAHKRHLQTQADASALAGGSRMQLEGCANAAVLNEAFAYAGAPGSDENVPAGVDDAARVEMEHVVTDPCGEGAVETRVRESGVPWYFPLAGLADVELEASARVELKQIDSLTGALPLALQEPAEIKGVMVDLVDETRALDDPARVIATQDLAIASQTEETATWSNAAGAFTHNVTESALGFRVRVLYGTATACDAETVECFDADAAGRGLLHVHGFEQPSATPAAANRPPVLKFVELADTSQCADRGYFSAGGCSITVRATVDWVDVVEENPNSRAELTGRLGGSSFTLSRTAGEVWQGTATVRAGTAAQDLTLSWTQKDGRVAPTSEQGQSCANQPARRCEGVFLGSQADGVVNKGPGLPTGSTAATAVHRVFAATEERSGEIEFARALEAGTVTNSAERCAEGVTTCTHAWTVEVGLPAPLSLGAKRTLSAAAPGSNDGHLDCDPPGGGVDFELQMAEGCDAWYEINPGTDCPDPAELPDTEQPWNCVASSPGDKSGPFAQGMNTRVYGTQKPTVAQCVAGRNRYPDWEAGDPRIVTVMIVRQPSLEDSGNSIWPVKDFGQFYVTGWGDNGNPACAKTDSLNDDADKNQLVGHFIKYARPNDGTQYGTKACDAQQIGGCVPVMTK